MIKSKYQPHAVGNLSTLGLETPKLTSMRLLMEDHSGKRPVGILYDVLVKETNLYFLQTL